MATYSEQVAEVSGINMEYCTFFLNLCIKCFIVKASTNLLCMTLIPLTLKKNVSQQYGSFEDHSITVPVEHGKNI